MNPMTVYVDQEKSRLCFTHAGDKRFTYILERVTFDDTGKAIYFEGYRSQDGLRYATGVPENMITWMGDAL